MVIAVNTRLNSLESPFFGPGGQTKARSGRDFPLAAVWPCDMY